MILAVEHYEKHLEYIIILCYIVGMFIFHVISRVWISKALSESVKISGGKLVSVNKDNKDIKPVDGNTILFMPSSKRMGGYMIIFTVCFNEFYVTVMTQQFPDTHLLYMLISAGVCWGFITAANIITAWRGNSQQQPGQAQPAQK